MIYEQELSLSYAVVNCVELVAIQERYLYLYLQFTFYSWLLCNYLHPWSWR